MRVISDNQIYSTLSVSDFLTMPKLPRVVSLCGSLKTGTLIIGSLNLVGLVILIFASIVAVATPTVSMVVIC